MGRKKGNRQRRTGKRKKTRTHVVKEYDSKTPRSLVVKRGAVAAPVAELVSNLRDVMMPHTMKQLKERKSNKLKDFTAIAGPLGVSHCMFISQSANFNTTLRIACMPLGPTLSFRVAKYTLAKHVREKQRRPVSVANVYQDPPLVILNNFNKDLPHHQLATATFQNLFPALDIATIQLGACRRVLLFNYNKDTDHISMRHYAITANPRNVTRGVRQLIKQRIPNLQGMEDISEFIHGGGTHGAVTSDSEAGDETGHIVLPDRYRGQGNTKSAQSAIKLMEIGPRMELQLIKVEHGICDGEVLYHAHIEKDAKAQNLLRQKHAEKRALTEKRKAEQEANVDRKRQAREEKKLRKEERRRKAKEADGAEADGEDEEEVSDDEDENTSSPKKSYQIQHRRGERGRKRRC
eukprot:INCI1323.1.p1 GENE.INCI1323.1~~INCI1323.1.p1  ORF type:complete len:406 (-),score=86.13 INCI1323.1:620-1837(-)